MNAERYLPPKELSAALLTVYGLRLSPDYIRAIRRETVRRGERVFVLGMGKPSEVFEWARSNPQFRRRGMGAPGIV